MKEWADMRQNRRQKADAEEVAYTQRAVSSCTTSTDEKIDEERNGTAGGTPSFLKRYYALV